MEAVVEIDKYKNSFYLYEMAVVNKKEDETLFKTGNSQKTTPSNASSSLYSLLNKLQNVNKNSNDVKYSLDRRLNVNAPIVINVGDILKNSIRINELIPRNEHIEKSYALIDIAKNNVDEPYIVSFVVNKYANEIQSIDVLYAVNAKKEVAALDEPEFRPINGTALTTSKISISNLLDYVNNYFPDILPESVLKHYGYNSRPEGNIGESALLAAGRNIMKLTPGNA